MTKPYRIQRQRTAGWRMPANTIYVGRGSIWGNPFVVGQPSGVFPEGKGQEGKAETLIPALTLDQCVKFYRNCVEGVLTPEMYPAGHAFSDLRRPHANLHLLRGKNLMCWCPLDQKCHADVLLELANSETGGMTEPGAAPAMIPRYVRSTFEPDQMTYYINYTDRLTGNVVLSYDGADPANTNPYYGGKSDSEYLANLGHDINAEIEISQSVLPIPPGEAARHAAAKQRRLEREEEESNALDLLEFLGTDAEKFDFDDWSEGEHTILAPALEKRGYTSIRFYMGEQDSFGPLSRGCVATCHCGKRVRFFYG